MISKELFVSILDSMRKQLFADEKNSSLVAEAFGVSDFCLYDNSLLFKAIISLLSISFDKEELEHYIFQLNFGKLSSEEDFESSEQLYDRLKNLNKNEPRRER